MAPWPLQSTPDQIFVAGESEESRDTALVTISTDQSNSAFKGEDEDSDFDAGDSPSYVEATVIPTGTPAFQEDGGAAIAPDGTQLFGHQLYAGVNVLGDAGTCRFGGVVFVG